MDEVCLTHETSSFQLVEKSNDEREREGKKNRLGVEKSRLMAFEF